ncbi:hypothetical protein FKW77_004949 [Venturia effusa]|uniref:Uncharacterized protein n=1 Tax=Venturia effusa TaxID=50376 RepID=A0A517LLE4_9PEZI|nr:hypothetical protein FKW77_004949 [Venturia effusa]
MAPSSTACSDDLIAPYEIVFSCSLCQKTITDLYTKPRSDKGLSTGSDGPETVATKLWITDCGHVICGEHLEGGGVPFHPVDERPKAACPVCVKERSDLTDKKLFGIFQYLSMVRYGRAMRKRLEEAKQSLAAEDKRTRQQLASIQTLRKERAELQSSIERLEAVEKKYKAYKDREPEIKHYLGQFSGVATENALLKDQLVGLGYAVPQTEWSMKKPPPEGGAISCNHNNDAPRGEQRPAEASDVPFRNQYRQKEVQHLSSSSSRKRTREDYLEGVTDGDFEVLMEAPSQQRRRTRDSMLPPPLPTQHAAQRSLPTRRDHFDDSPSRQYLDSRSNIEVHPHENAPEVQAYQDGAWNNARRQDMQTPRPSRPYQPSGPPLMSGVSGLASGRRGSRIDRQVEGAVSQPRLTRPPPDPRNGNEVDSHHSMSQSHSNLLQYQQNHNEQIRNAQTPATRLLPSRAGSRSSFVRQPLVSVPAHGNIRAPDSGYYSNVNPHYTSGYEPLDENYGHAPSRQADHWSRPSFDSPFFKPHFHGPVQQQESPMRQRGATHQSEQLTSGLRHLRMEPVSQQPQPRTIPSLNALSFIDEPYTSANQPVFSRRSGPFSRNQEEQPYRPAVISRAGFIQDPRIPHQVRQQSNSIRLPSAMPPSSQQLAHTSKGSRSGGSMSGLSQSTTTQV